MNIPEDRFEKVTDDKSMNYLDLQALVEYVALHIQDMQRSPDTFLGSCSVRQMLSSDNIEYGLLENGKLVLRIDRELFEMDLSSLQEAFYTQNDSVPRALDLP